MRTEDLWQYALKPGLFCLVIEASRSHFVGRRAKHRQASLQAPDNLRTAVPHRGRPANGCFRSKNRSRMQSHVRVAQQHCSTSIGSQGDVDESPDVLKRESLDRDSHSQMQPRGTLLGFACDCFVHSINQEEGLPKRKNLD